MHQSRISLVLGVDGRIDLLDDLRLRGRHRQLLDTADGSQGLRLDIGRRARNRVKTGFRGFDVLAGYDIHRADGVLDQSLAGGAQQQAGEPAAAAGADDDHVMVIAGLGQRLHGVARHHGAVIFRSG